MSKNTEAKATKKIKKKANGFDVMYRVVTAVLAVAVFPVVYFMNLIYYAFNSTNCSKLLNNITEILSSGNILEGIKNFLSPVVESDADQAIEITEGYICLAKFDELKTMMNMVPSDGNSSLKELLASNALLRPAFASLVLFAVVLVLALVILIISIFKTKPKLIAAISGVGTALIIISNLVFIIGFANPIVSNEMSLDQIINVDSFLGQIVLQAIGTAMEVRYDNAFFTVMFIMLGIFVWSLAVLIVNSGDKEYKREAELKKAKKKAKKAEKKAKKEKKNVKKVEKKLKKEQKEEKKQAEEKNDAQ